ncbi:MAG: DUF1080 domain-containing protein [Acidobacteriota bacterium]
MSTFAFLVMVLFLNPNLWAQPQPEAEGFVPLLPKDGVPEGWVARAWNDVSQPSGEPAVWKVENGVLHGGEPRGTWLMQERLSSDLILEYEFKLGETGNSGLALRAPMKGDPAFDGLELQMADFRYNTEAKDSELTGGLYRVVAPTRQLYRPTQWNRCQVTLIGRHLKVVLNGETIQDLNLDEQVQEVRRHDGTLAPAIKDRPRQGHLGFQELSRGSEHVQIRNARVKWLD